MIEEQRIEQRLSDKNGKLLRILFEEGADGLRKDGLIARAGKSSIGDPIGMLERIARKPFFCDHVKLPGGSGRGYRLVAVDFES